MLNCALSTLFGRELVPGCLVATGLPPAPWPTSSTVGAIRKAELTKKTPRIEFNVCWYWDNVKLRLITTSALAEVRFRHDGPCVSSLGLRTGKRNLSTGEHIHIFHRMLAFVSGAEKLHIMPINTILVPTSHSELSTITRRCFAYQFHLPNMKHIMTSPRSVSICISLSCAIFGDILSLTQCGSENLYQKVM